MRLLPLHRLVQQVAREVRVTYKGSGHIILRYSRGGRDPMVVDHWFMQVEKVLEAMEITSETTRIRLVAFQLEVEALEEPLYVSSPLGIRGTIGMICRGCELEISGILLTVDLRVMDLSELDVILGIDWLTAYRAVIDCERRRVTAYTQDGTRVVFQGDKHDILPQAVYESRCQGQFAGWLASLTLKDEVRPDLDLPRVVCEYEDVFPNELLGFPPQRVVEFGIKLHPGTSPISMTPHRMTPVELQELIVQLHSYWTRGSLDRELHHGALRFYLRRRRTRPFDCPLTTDS